MNTLIHADIFFFVSTIALIIITIGFIIALIYFIKILRDVSEVSSMVKKESVEILDDIKTLRADIKKEGFRMGRFAKFFGRMFFKKRMTSKDEE